MVRQSDAGCKLFALNGMGPRLMTTLALENDLKAAIRNIPDYPKPGILFRDITTLLGNARAFRRAVDELVQPWAGSKIDKVAGIEARGFILGGAVAHQVSAGFVPIRKKGKLPYKRVTIAYSLEYGIDEMEMHEDAVSKGERVILVDDLIATGGTAEAAVKLLQQIGADVLAACFIIDLPDLGGAEKIGSSTCRCARSSASRGISAKFCLGRIRSFMACRASPPLRRHGAEQAPARCGYGHPLAELTAATVTSHAGDVRSLPFRRSPSKHCATLDLSRRLRMDGSHHANFCRSLCRSR